MIQKTQCLSISFSWWAICRARPKQGYGMGVWTRFVLPTLSVGLKSGYGIIFLKVLRHRNTGECLELFVDMKRKRKRRSLVSSASLQTPWSYSVEQETPASGSLLSCIPKRKCSRAYNLSFLLLLIFAPGLFPWPKSYFTLAPALVYWIFQGFSISPLIYEMRGSDKPD